MAVIFESQHVGTKSEQTKTVRDLERLHGYVEIGTSSRGSFLPSLAARKFLVPR
jgi:hypothetical protein